MHSRFETLLPFSATHATATVAATAFATANRLPTAIAASASTFATAIALTAARTAAAIRPSRH